MNRYQMKHDSCVTTIGCTSPRQSMTDGLVTIVFDGGDGSRLISLQRQGFEATVQLTRPDTLMFLTLACRAWAIKPEEIKP